MEPIRLLPVAIRRVLAFAAAGVPAAGSVRDWRHQSVFYPRQALPISPSYIVRPARKFSIYVRWRITGRPLKMRLFDAVAVRYTARLKWCRRYCPDDDGCTQSF